MNPRIQDLVLAQVSISRAVFAANQPKPREVYIDECIAEAQSSLADAALTEIKRRARTERLNKKTA